MLTLTLTLWLIKSGLLISLIHPHLSSSLTDSLRNLDLLCHSKTDARFMQDGLKAVWRIPYVFVVFFPSLKHNFIAYRPSNVSSRPGCIFEIHQLWQSGFSRVYPNCCCSCSLEPEIMKNSQWSLKMYNNNILNFQESIWDACTKKRMETYWMHHVLTEWHSSVSLLFFYLDIFSLALIWFYFYYNLLSMVSKKCHLLKWYDVIFEHTTHFPVNSY